MITIKSVSLPLADTAIALTCTILVLLAITVSMFLSLIIIRIVVRRREVRTDKVKESLRPLIYELLTSDISPEEVAAEIAVRVSRKEYPELEQVMLENARVLKGGELEILITSFDRLGFVDEDIENLQKGRMLKKAEAAFHLGTMHAHRAVPFLAEALQNRSLEVVFSCLNSLSKIGSPGAVKAVVDYLSTNPDIGTIRVAEVILERKQSFGPYLLAWLNDNEEDPPRLTLIINLIGAMKYEQAVPVLLRYLTHPDPEVRASTAEALGSIGDFSACGKLEETVDDEEPGVRARAAEALGKIQCDGAVGKLKGGLSDTYLEVKMNCAVALTQLGEEGRAALEDALSVTEEIDRGVAAEALQKDRIGKEYK
ncbi:MAG: HEAT repeat domain-containing protein [Actinobacteria bacterium]|nr:HEAT repeat domain-containing protein [Actinomycetota bacterium]